MNILCSLDDDYAAPTAVMLTSLFANTPGKGFRVFVAHDGLSGLTKRVLRRVCERSGHEMVLVQPEHAALPDLPIKREHLTLASYYRLLVADMLPKDLDRVIYLDGDLVVRRDLRPFYEMDMGDSYVAASAQVFVEGQKERLGMLPDEHVFNAGVLVMNLPVWRDEGFGERALRFALEQSHRMVGQDQDAMNATSQGRAMIVEQKWNAGQWLFAEGQGEVPGATPEQLREAREDPAIAHFTGSNKPWIGGTSHPFAHEYFVYLKQTPYFGPRHLVRRARSRGLGVLRKLVSR